MADDKKTNEKKQRLLTLLREMFQLDQPDLDFGLYRIMHAKRGQVEAFLETEFDHLIDKVFAHRGVRHEEEAKQEYEAARQQAIEFGAPDPDAAPKVQQARARYEVVRLTGGEDAEIYDHLHRFFSRYYDQGDFMSLRRYGKGAAGGAETYAVPYDGSEVVLHWANKDQYYIKTTENFAEFSFDPRKALQKDERGISRSLFEEVGAGGTALKVHFRIVEAAEGAHNNVKASDKDERYFILDAEMPLAWEGNELVVRINFRQDSEKPPKGQKAKWQDTRNEQLVQTVLESLKGLTDGGNALAGEYFEVLAREVSKGKDKKQPLLARYAGQYTASNTMDYFIHKDLGGFLRRELDFYLKNEILKLDDFVGGEDADVQAELNPARMKAMKEALEKTQAIRLLSQRLIDFLAQLEEFQKKLWLKKKFVVETHYCITLDRIPEKFYHEIAANDRQREEWVKLFAIDQIKGDMATLGYSTPLTEGFLAANPFLAVDTALFPDSFKQRLLAEIDGLDMQCEGVLINSENFQALNLIRNKLENSVKYIFIDPPYNTGGDGFIYKDSYRHGCWLSMLHDRIGLARNLMTESAGGACNINDIEDWRFRGIIETCLDEQSYITTVVTKCSTASSFRTVNLGPVDVTDRIVLFAKNRSTYRYCPQYVPKGVDLQHFSRFVENADADYSSWVFKSIKLHVMNEMGIECSDTRAGMAIARKKWGDAAEAIIRDASEKFAIANAHRVFETKTLQKPSKWLIDRIEASKKSPGEIVVAERDGEEPIILLGGRQFYFLGKGVREVDGAMRVTEPASTLWVDIDTNNLKSEGGVDFPSGKKPLRLVGRLISTSDQSVGEWMMDFFAGSGTLGHAVVERKRSGAEGEKYLLVEMGDHFDQTLLPRMKKVVYATTFQGGLPSNRDGISQCFKYLRVESYEDCLNNLVLNPVSDTVFKEGDGAIQRDYLLRYMLAVETQGSQSLLNVAQFRDPTAYQLEIKKPGSDEREKRRVDLVETFNWLIGLHVDKLHAGRRFAATFVRKPDPLLPEDANTRLQVETLTEAEEGAWWFRPVEGYVRTKPGDDRHRQSVLVLWRTLTDDPEQDAAALEAYLSQQMKFDPTRREDKTLYDIIYINGTHNLPNLGRYGEVRLLEEEFHRRMWAGEEN